MKSAIIISISSDIGHALARAWLAKNYRVYGTYRTWQKNLSEIEALGVKLFECDLSDKRSIQHTCVALKKSCDAWDVLVLCPGLLGPIGLFENVNFDEWEQSVHVNFTSQMRVVHELLAVRNKRVEQGPLVLFFAGGGTNNATRNYSAYLVSKIALIKMCELLDFEMTGTRFVIVGPGWVKTKIHLASIDVGPKGGESYWRTIDKFQDEDFVPMERVVNCCDWLLGMPANVISGRNLSVEFDRWGSQELEQVLLKNPEMYKLRRAGNDWKP